MDVKNNVMVSVFHIKGRRKRSLQPPHTGAEMAPLLLLLLCVFSPPSSTLTSAYKIRRYDTTTASNSTVTGAGNGNAAAVFNASKKYEGSSELVHMRYHMGPVLTSEIRLYIIWYGDWPAFQKSTIKDFLHSISNSPPAAASRPSVTQWWNTVQLYTDQTGANVSRSVILVAEHNDPYSHGRILSRMTVQEVIRTAILSPPASAGSLPVDSEGGLYMVLTADDVVMQDFCRAVCGFHYFTFPSIVGFTLPYAWVGNSGKQCPELCAYPFAVPAYMTGVTPLKPPNGDVGVEGMISVIGHELAELSSNPLINAWYAGNDPTEPTEIADLCEGIYGPGGGGSYMGSVLQNPAGATYNMIGVKKRKFLVQWIWNHILGYCTGPNS